MQGNLYSSSFKQLQVLCIATRARLAILRLRALNMSYSSAPPAIVESLRSSQYSVGNSTVHIVRGKRHLSMTGYKKFL